MSNERNDGGPAFPCEMQNETGGNILVGGQVIPPGSRVVCLGASLRDYFAAKAMQGMVAGLAARSERVDGDDLVRHAFRMADAMLKARQQ